MLPCNHAVRNSSNSAARLATVHKPHGLFGTVAGLRQLSTWFLPVLGQPAILVVTIRREPRISPDTRHSPAVPGAAAIARAIDSSMTSMANGFRR